MFEIEKYAILNLYIVDTMSTIKKIIIKKVYHTKQSCLNLKIN